MELTLYFLRLAPWIVRPASPSARAGTMMAAIRTKFEVALGRAGWQDLEAAQSLPLRLQPLHGGFHGAQAQRAETAQDGGERGRW